MRRAGNAIASGLALFLCLAPLGQSSAATAVLEAVADASLFEDPTGTLANGAGANLFVGRTGANAGALIRRGLLRFDLSSLPPGAVVSSASVRLSLTRSRFAGDLPVGLHRVLSSWTTGTSSSSQGAGEPATSADATWVHRSFPAMHWNTPGGDFVATASVSIVVGSTGGPYNWSATPQLVADVNGWLSQPASNHGWLMRGFEGPITSAKAFASREAADPADRPILIVEYDVPQTADGEGDVPLPAWAIMLLGLALAGASFGRRG